MKIHLHLLFWMGLGLSSSSFANLISVPDLKKYCQTQSPRQTIIYLDQSIIAKTDKNWFRDILNKVKYLPGEPVTFAMFEASNSRTKDIWSGCHASVSSEKMKQLMDERGLFSKSPKKQLEEDQKLFRRNVIKSLEVPMRASGLEQKPNFDGDFPKKSIVEAIYYDSAKYDLKHGATRVIIFSDMVENSNQVNPEKLTAEEAKDVARNLAKRYPFSMNNAQIYVHGVGYTHGNSELDRNLKTFWQYFVNHSSGHLVSFQQQLPAQTAQLDFDALSYSGVMKLDGRDIATSLRLSIPSRKKAGKLVNAWYAMSDMTFPLKGTFNCAGNQCVVNGEIIFGDEGYKTFQTGDVLKLKGSLDKLKGYIGSKDQTTVNTEGQDFRYSLSFIKDEQLLF